MNELRSEVTDSPWTPHAELDSYCRQRALVLELLPYSTVGHQRDLSKLPQLAHRVRVVASFSRGCKTRSQGKQRGKARRAIPSYFLLLLAPFFLFALLKVPLLLASFNKDLQFAGAGRAIAIPRRVKYFFYE